MVLLTYLLHLINCLVILLFCLSHMQAELFNVQQPNLAQYAITGFFFLGGGGGGSHRLEADICCIYRLLYSLADIMVSETSGVRRSLSNNASDLRSSSSSEDGDVGSDVGGECLWTLRGGDDDDQRCAHLLVLFGFAVTLTWICALWIVVRVLRRRRRRRRRRPGVVADVAAQSSLCACRIFGRRDVLSWAASLSRPGELRCLKNAPF